MTSEEPDVATVAALITDLAAASAGTPADRARLVGLLGSRFGAGSRRLDAGADLALLDAVAALWERGWAPRDVPEIVRRRVGPHAVAAALDLLAADAARRPRGWAADLAGLGAERWWDPARPLVTQWRAARDASRADALGLALTLVAALRRLPALPVTAAEEPGSGADPKVLARVRGLLAKAESTAFPEEAEALSAKAQELMNRHALEQAVVDAGTDRVASASARRLWLDTPYVSAKSSLVSQVATANRCRAISLDALDLVTVVGHPGDLAAVELLVTSLLVQADRALLAEGRRTTASGRSRTRSFRHAFLLAYATRIGERLRDAEREARSRVEESTGTAFLPVLAARAEMVERTVGELFPRLATRRFSVGNAAGWHAGRAAADAARLRPERREVPR